MINKEKHINYFHLKTTNFFKDSLIPIKNRQNISKSNLGIYFIRQIGINSSSLNDYNNYISSLKNKTIEFKIIDKKLTLDSNFHLIATIKNHFKNLNENLSNIDEVIIKSTPILLNPYFKDNSVLSSIVGSILNATKLYLKNEKNVNISKFVNFYIKLIYWLINYSNNLVINLKNLSLENFINPKLIYIGEISKHETYLLFTLFNMGIDIIYLNETNDALINQNPNLNEFTNEIIISSSSSNLKYSTKKNNAFSSKNNIINANTNKNSNINNSVKSINNNIKTTKNVQNNIKTKKNFTKSILITKKEFKGELDEVTKKLNERIGYVPAPKYVLPTYFIRYIGVSNNIDIYKNKLYSLNQKLKKYNYIKFENNIKINNPKDIINSTNGIWKNSAYTKEDINDLTEYLNGSNALAFIRNEKVKNQFLFSLKYILTTVFDDNNQIEASKLKNLTIKLISWIKDSYNHLFLNFNYDSIENPKVLYYGNIKKHEALFLILLYNMGVDIIYINTFNDDIFEILDSKEVFSSIYVLDKVHKYFDYPKEEILVRHETVAYKASEEISKIIHNEEDGVYRPWQFESYNPKPVTLITTFEEFNILWNEEARFRASFKVENKNVYIPNLFVKISGTHLDIDEYFKLIYNLKNHEKSILYNELPIITSPLSKQEVFRLTSVFDKEENLIKENLINHELYKYSYLSDITQNRIIKKIEELFKTNILKQSLNIKDKLFILSTILNLDKKLLEMLQNFDYPSHIPKLIIYDSKETTFSFEDAIIMAFLYINGFDIAVFTPTSYNNFEMHINDNFYDIFKLEDKKFNLTLPDLNKYKSKKGFWSNFFNK